MPYLSNGLDRGTIPCRALRGLCRTRGDHLFIGWQFRANVLSDVGSRALTWLRSRAWGKSIHWKAMSSKHINIHVDISTHVMKCKSDNMFTWSAANCVQAPPSSSHGGEPRHTHCVEVSVARKLDVVIRSDICSNGRCANHN